MTLYQQLNRYRAAIRQALVCAELVPDLPAWHHEWRDLPGGHPDGLDRETRYALAAYRAALAEQERVRAWLTAHRAEMWRVAVEAEAALSWQMERAHLRAAPDLAEGEHTEWSVAA